MKSKYFSYCPINFYISNLKVKNINVNQDDTKAFAFVTLDQFLLKKRYGRNISVFEHINWKFVPCYAKNQNSDSLYY